MRSHWTAWKSKHVVEPEGVNVKLESRSKVTDGFQRYQLAIVVRGNGTKTMTLACEVDCDVETFFAECKAKLDEVDLKQLQSARRKS